jgi:hypothetical protein
MVEIFITDIEDAQQAKQMKYLLESCFATLQFNLDLENSRVGNDFPCRHTILRVEGNTMDTDRIMATMSQLGFRCEVLVDKICR